MKTTVTNQPSSLATILRDVSYPTGTVSLLLQIALTAASSFIRTPVRWCHRESIEHERCPVTVVFADQAFVLEWVRGHVQIVGGLRESEPFRNALGLYLFVRGLVDQERFHETVLALVSQPLALNLDGLAFRIDEVIRDGLIRLRVFFDAEHESADH